MYINQEITLLKFMCNILNKIGIVDILWIWKPHDRFCDLWNYNSEFLVSILKVISITLLMVTLWVISIWKYWCARIQSMTCNILQAIYSQRFCNKNATINLSVNKATNNYPCEHSFDGRNISFSVIYLAIAIVRKFIIVSILLCIK